MSKFATLPYRKGVGIMLFNNKGKVFVAKRIDMTSEAWQMPQGGIDEGEDARTAAMRELKEEIGTDEVDILAESQGWYSYDLPDDLVPLIWHGRFRGQEQKWFAMRLKGDDSCIDIKDVDHPEFSEWKWVDAQELPDIIVPFKRDLYSALIKEFSRLIK